MKSVVLYVSRSGNTKKVAEAIAEALPGEVLVTDAAEAEPVPADTDMVFFGMPVHDYGAPRGVAETIERTCAGRRMAMFVTHAAPEGVPHLEPWLQACRDTAQCADLVGFFACQGALAQPVIQAMLKSDSADVRRWAAKDNSQGQPDESRLDAARAFAREVAARFEGETAARAGERSGR